jgi:hypothetical protein
VRAATVAIAPVLLAAALLWHPFIAGRLPNDQAIAEAVVEGGATRWGLVHLGASAASAVVILAFIAIRGYLREAGDARRSGIGLGFVVLGSVGFAVLPGMEFGVLAAVESGGDAVAIQAVVDDWFLPVLLTGAILFAIGVAFVAMAVVRFSTLSQSTAWIVAIALLVMAVSRIAPFAAVQFYVQSAAALIALWPLAWVIRQGTGSSQAP